MLRIFLVSVTSPFFYKNKCPNFDISYRYLSIFNFAMKIIPKLDGPDLSLDTPKFFLKKVLEFQKQCCGANPFLTGSEYFFHRLRLRLRLQLL